MTPPLPTLRVTVKAHKFDEESHETWYFATVERTDGGEPLSVSRSSWCPRFAIRRAVDEMLEEIVR